MLFGGGCASGFLTADNEEENPDDQGGMFGEL